MAGTDSSEIRDSFVKESTAGTTPATPTFLKSSFDLITMRGAPRFRENAPKAAQGQRGGISRNGDTISGQARGKLVYGEFDDWWESLFQATWTSNVLVNAQEQKTLTIEQSVPQGAGGTFAHTRFRGVEAATGRLEMVAEQDVQFFLDLLGQGYDNATATAISGATYDDPTYTDIVGTGSDISTLTMSGFTLDCMEACRIDFNVQGKAEQPRIASDDPCGVSRGVMRPIITGRFYIETNFISFYNAARAGTDFAMAIQLGQTSGQRYLLEFPSCEFVETPLAPQEEGPVYMDYRILPKYHAATGGTVKLTRAV